MGWLEPQPACLEESLPPYFHADMRQEPEVSRGGGGGTEGAGDS